MCGLVGFISKKSMTDLSSSYTRTSVQETYIQTALFLDTLRGRHSTGLFGKSLLRKESSLEVIKKAISAPDFLDLKQVKEMVEYAGSYWFMVGHNRYATVGGITNVNAHPFTHGNITLAHNGTLPKDHGLDGNFEVDSECIAYTMAKYGEKETLERIIGAYALMWYNEEDDSFNVARNSERPMHFAYIKDGQMLAFASEGWMVRGSLERAGYTDKDYTQMTLNPGFHVKIKRDSDMSDISNLATEFKIAKKPVVSAKSYYQDGLTYPNQDLLPWPTLDETPLLTSFGLCADSLLRTDVLVTDINYYPYPEGSTYGGNRKVEYGKFEGTIVLSSDKETLAHKNKIKWVKQGIMKSAVGDYLKEGVYKVNLKDTYINRATGVEVATSPPTAPMTLVAANLTDYYLISSSAPSADKKEKSELVECTWCAVKVPASDAHEILFDDTKPEETEYVCSDCQEYAINSTQAV